MSSISLASLNTPAAGTVVSGGGFNDSSLVSVQYTAANLTTVTNPNPTTVYPTWTVVAGSSKYPSNISPTTLVDGNGAINLPAGVWMMTLDFAFGQSSGTSNLTTANVVNVYWDTKGLLAVPSQYGYYTGQLVYQKYFSTPTTIPKIGFLTGFVTTISNLQLNITRISK